MYTPRAPPVEYGGLFGDYLKKLSLAHTRRVKDKEPFIQSCPKIVSLKDRVKALEGLCDSLMILPKEIKSLKARVYKLETIINHKDNTSGKQCDLGDKYWSDQDGEPFFKYMGSTNPSANKDVVNDLVDALDDLVDENGVVEDLKRPSKCIDKIYCNYYLEQFLITSGWSRCKFLWRTEIVVGRHFWDSLIGLDDERLGWLVDDHIELWVWYMWHFRQSFDDWSMVSCYFLTLLLQDSMSLFYATDEIYPLAWRDVEQVFIPINEPKRHWSLAQFHIKSGNVTFYDNQKTYDPEFHPWYVKMRSCLESKLPVVLQQTGVFASKGTDPTSYSIKFTNAQNVPKQGGVFGDCGVFVCLFLYRLAHGIPLDVECDNHDLSRLVKLLVLTYVSVAMNGLCVYVCCVGYARFDNQSIERDRLIRIGFVLDFVEFISFTFSDKEMILVIEAVSR
ncbi:phospholipase-like protein [Tanacetum coccineum]